MAPKKTAAAKAKAAKPAAPKHASFQDMIKDAIVNLKERNGSSRQAIKKYIYANNNLTGMTEGAFNKHISRALEVGEGKVFEFPKGKSGPVKLKKPGPATEKSEKAKTVEKKVTKAKSTTKAAPAKKVAVTKKAPTTTKKAATKTKANASKPRKTAPAAPAVEDKPAVVLGKTKSGRVTKTKAPQAAKPAKKAAPKKTATKKAPKKSATPKKSEPKAESTA